MEIGRERWINYNRLIIIKTLQIQRYWRMCTSNLNYSLARRKIIGLIEK